MVKRIVAEPKLIRSVYIPKTLWDKIENIASEESFKSRNAVIEKALYEFISNRKVKTI